jgi:SAM-dependent methyltransferase
VTITPHDPVNICLSYDSAAQGYAEHLADELDHKPLDRHLLNRFAEETRGRGMAADFGCGPGQAAGYLRGQGLTEVLGLDLSPEMVGIAARLHPGVEFRVDDMRAPRLADASLAGIVSFYSIVHFEQAELGAIFGQMRRVLAEGALALVAFHIGEEIIHRDELFGARVSLDFRFHDPAKVAAALASAGLPVIEHTERAPYPEVEHPSRRCYLLARTV